jgi:hypothetical protein
MYFSVAIDTKEVVDPFPAYYIFNVMLNILFILHIFWTMGIVRLLVQLISDPSATVDDVRSSESEVSDENNDTENHKHKTQPPTAVQNGDVDTH